jgi:hypothetical protein
MKDYIPSNDILSSLRLFFWGGLLCLCDVSIKYPQYGNGFKIDILSDTVGLLLILFGLFKIKNTCFELKCQSLYYFTVIMSTSYLLVSIHNHFIYSVPKPIIAIISLITICYYISILVFYVIMIRVFKYFDLSFPIKLWKSNLIIFGVAIGARIFLSFAFQNSPEIKLRYIWNEIILSNYFASDQVYSFFVSPITKITYTLPLLFTLVTLHLSKKDIMKHIFATMANQPISADAKRQRG